MGCWWPAWTQHSINGWLVVSMGTMGQRECFHAVLSLEHELEWRAEQAQGCSIILLIKYYLASVAGLQWTKWFHLGCQLRCYKLIGLLWLEWGKSTRQHSYRSPCSTFWHKMDRSKLKEHWMAPQLEPVCRREEVTVGGEYQNTENSASSFQSERKLNITDLIGFKSAELFI